MASALINAANAGTTVLVPNAELAAALFDAVERAHRAAGREIWPTPRVREFGSWLKERYLKRQFDDSATPRVLSDIEERELWRSVVLESDSSRQFLEPSGAAGAARRARRALHEYGIPLAAIERYGTEEALAFLEWNERFTARCHALRCIGADELLAAPERALGESAMQKGLAIAWIESPSWRPVARRWLEQHAGSPLEPEVAARAGADPGAMRIAKAASGAAELAALAEWTQIQLQAMPDFRAFVCVPDLAQRRAELTDALDAVLAPRRFSLDDAQEGAPYAIAGGTPLADYPSPRAALTLLSVSVGVVSFDEFSALLRAPELSGSVAEASTAAQLDILLRGRAPSEAALEDWLALAGTLAREASMQPVAALRRLNDASRLLAKITGTHPMSRWLSSWMAALDAGPWNLRQRWSSTEYQAAERFRELLAALASGDSVFGSQSRASAQGILLRAARNTPFQTQTGVPSILISGQLMDPWLTYDGLWVTGCSAARWPPPVDPIPLLPVQLQREYAVVPAALESQLGFALDLARRWRARAASGVLSYAEEPDGHSALPSPLLNAAAPASPGTLIAAPAPHWTLQWKRAPAFEERLDQQAPPFDPGHEKTHGVATLKAQSRCAFRGFAETRLGAQALERPLPGFNDRERGELVHDALHRIWSTTRDSSRLMALAVDPPALAGLIRASVREAIGKLCARRNPGIRWREREQRRLESLIDRWLEFERSRTPFVAERLELAREVARHGGLEFTVRIDRIDRLADGSQVLIDYKSGSARPDWRGERPDNPQLTVYALLHPDGLSAVAYGRINASECGFEIESDRDGIFPGKRKTQLEGMGSFAELIGVWSSRIEKLAADFAHGRACVDPTPTACRSCTLHGLCRVPSTLDISLALDSGVQSP